MIESPSVFMAIISIVTFVLSGFSTVLWYALRKLEDHCEKNKDALVHHELMVAREYTPRTEFDNVFRKLEDIQASIKVLSGDFRDRLDKKLDK